MSVGGTLAWFGGYIIDLVLPETEQSIDTFIKHEAWHWFCDVKVLDEHFSKHQHPAKVIWQCKNAVVQEWHSWRGPEEKQIQPNPMTSSVRICLIYINIQNVCSLSTIFMVKKNQDTFLASKSYMHFDPRISETKSLKKETTSIPARKKQKSTSFRGILISQLSLFEARRRPPNPLWRIGTSGVPGT